VREHFEGWFMHSPNETLTGSSARSLYLVMNWVEGPSLREWVPLHRAAADHFEGLKYLAQVGDVLDWLHSGQATPSSRPVIHADVTPANVIITEAGQAVLVDFGLVRVVGGTSDAVEGTRGYMAPEVLSAGQYSAASDRYAFGALAYFVLTGEHPPTDIAALRSKLAAVPAVAAQPELLDHLMTMFDPDPSLRPPAGEWIRRFRVSSSTAAAMAGLPPGMPGTTAPMPIVSRAKSGSKRRPMPLIAAAVAAALAVLVAVAIVVSSGGGTKNAGANRSTTTSSSSTSTSTSTSTSEVPTTTTEAPTDSAGFTSSGSGTGGTGVNSPDAKAAYLDQEHPVDGYTYSTGAAKANAIQYLHGITLSAGCSGSSFVEYDLSRTWKRLQATVALKDDSEANAQVFYALYFDGVKVASGPVRFGTSTPLNLDATNVLRVRMEMTRTYSGSCGDAYEVWGDPQVTR